MSEQNLTMGACEFIEKPTMDTAEGLGVVIMCPSERCKDQIIALSAFDGEKWTDEEQEHLANQDYAMCWNCASVTVKLPTPEQVDDFVRSLAR